MKYLETTCFLIYKLGMRASLNYLGNQMKHCIWKHFVTYTALRNIREYHYGKLNTSHIIIIWIHVLSQICSRFLCKQLTSSLHILAKRKSIYWLAMYCTGHMMINSNNIIIELQNWRASQCPVKPFRGGSWSTMAWGKQGQQRTWMCPPVKVLAQVIFDSSTPWKGGCSKDWEYTCLGIY